MIEPLDKDDFIDHMRASEQYGDYAHGPVERFYEWMYRSQDGVVQTCAFPVPPKDKDKADMGEGNGFMHVPSTSSKNSVKPTLVCGCITYIRV